MSEQSRNEFEKWFKQSWFYLRCNQPESSAQWEAWQAARTITPEQLRAAGWAAKSQVNKGNTAGKDIARACFEAAGLEIEKSKEALT